MTTPARPLRRLLATALLAATAATIVTTTAAPAPLANAADGGPLPGFGVNGVVLDSGLAQPGQILQVFKVIDDRLGALTALVDIFTPTSPPPGDPFPSRPPPSTQLLVKYTPAGTRDTSFGVNGVFTLPGSGAHDIANLADGSIIVAGSTDNFRLRIVDRFGTGSVPVGTEKSFGSTFIAPDRLVELGDGRVLHLSPRSYETTMVVVAPNRIAEPPITVLAPSGSNRSANGTVLADGRIILAITADNSGPDIWCRVVMYTSDLRLDTSFGSGGATTTWGQCDGIHAEPAGGFLVEFWDPITEKASLRRYTRDGTELPAPTMPTFDSLVVEGTGRVLVARFTPGPKTHYEVHAFTPDWADDTTFGAMGPDPTLGLRTGRIELPLLRRAQLAVLSGGDVAVTGWLVGASHVLYLGMVDSPWGPAAQPPALAMTAFTAVAPARILDTRDGTGAPVGPLGQGGRLTLRVTGRGGVPNSPDVAAVVLNVTATEAAAAGFVTVWPAGGSRPGVSSLNLDRAGQTVANQVTVRLGAGGSVSLFSQTGTHLVADVAGYYVTVADAVASGRFVPVGPTRVLDTRDGTGAPAQALGTGGQLDVQITGRASIPATGVRAVVFNLTATESVNDGFFTAWPSGGPRPNVSNLNVVQGETRANLAVVPVGAGGRVSLFSQAGAHLIADVAGYFTDATAPVDFAGLFVPIDPRRILDSRFGGAARVAGTTTLVNQVGSTTIAPPYDMTAAIVANLTVTATTEPGYVTTWPHGGPMPTVSNVNSSTTDSTVANAALIPLGADSFDLYVQRSTHVIVDVFGYYLRY